jgi:hypothetical protein
MDMSPSSILCREGRLPVQQPYYPSQPVQPRPSPFMPRPYVPPSNCPMDMRPSSIACRERRRHHTGRGKKVGKCGKSRKEGCECSDDEMEGGFLGALVSGLARAIPAVARSATSAVSRAVPSLSRVGSTASRSTAIVPYSASRASASLARASAPSLTSRLATASRGFASRVPSASTLGNIAGIGLPIGLSVYQAVDYEKQKGLAEQQARQMQAETDKALAEQQRQVDAEVAFLNEQRRLAELEASALKEARDREASEWERMLAEQEAEQRRQAELEAQYQAEAQRQYEEMLMLQQQQIEEQIRRQLEGLFAPRPSAPAPSQPAPRPSQPSAPAPSQPSRPSQPSAPAPAPPSSGATPPAGMTAKERKIWEQQQAQMRGRGKRKPSARNELVKRVMREKGLNLAQASKYVKENGLY